MLVMLLRSQRSMSGCCSSMFSIVGAIGVVVMRWRCTCCMKSSGSYEVRSTSVLPRSQWPGMP